MMREASLRSKFLVLTIGLIVGLGLIILIFVQTVLYGDLAKSLQKRELALAKDLARDSVNAILSEDIFTLKSLLFEHKEHGEDIAYSFILDHEGNVLAHTFGETFPMDLKEANRVVPGQPYSIRSLSTERGGVFDTAVPILKGEAGVVRVGVWGGPIKKEVAGFVRLIVGVVLGILLLGIWLAVFFIKAITKPVAELVRMAEAVGAGDLEQRIRVASRDEIGKLGLTFNRMSERLKEYVRKEKQAAATAATVDVERKKAGELVFLNEQLMAANKELRMTAEELERKSELIEKLSRKEWSQTFDAISDFVFLLDADRGILKANKAVTDALQCNPEEIIGKKCYELMHKSGQVCPECPFEITKGDKKAHSRLLEESAVEVPLLITTFPIFGNNGDVVGSVHIAKDVSELKKIETELTEKKEQIGIYQSVTLGREQKFVGLKAEINCLLEKLGKKPYYTGGRVDEETRERVEQMLTEDKAL